MSGLAPGSLIANARLGVAVRLGALVGHASRLAGRGSGASIRGQVILRIAPGALVSLMAGKRVAMVSGTNGKTTTTHFLAAAIRQHLKNGESRVVHNADGANLINGVVSALSSKPGAEFAILEADERVVPKLIQVGSPEILVLLNFFSDQLDRNHDMNVLARSWREALEAAGASGPVVVANASEPLIVWAAQGAREVIWVNPANTKALERTLCPACGATLIREEPEGNGGAVGDWRCTQCDLAQPAATYSVFDSQVVDAQGHAWDPQLNVPGEFNVSNAACALAAANTMGVPSATAFEGFRTVSAPSGRYATVEVEGTTARLLLAKNPVGWVEALVLAQTPTVIVAIDSLTADGRDVSWLWDVDFETLRGRTIIITGPRAQDFAVRLSHCDIEYTCVPDLAEALAGHQEPVDVISTYSPFLRLLKMGGL